MQQHQQAPPPPGYQQPPQAVGYQPPPPPPGYAGGQTTTVYTTAPVAMAPLVFREIPVPMTCQYCHCSITTTTTYEVGLLNWLLCGILIIVGLWIGCCVIPFCINSCKDVVHTCPNCNQVVGKFLRFN